jgi:hypothetical protein
VLSGGSVPEKVGEMDQAQFEILVRVLAVLFVVDAAFVLAFIAYAWGHKTDRRTGRA